MDTAALFCVRTEAAERVKAAMEQHKHKLSKDSVGVKYNNAVTFIENIEGMLEDEYFEAATDGMKGLMDEIPNDVTTCKANVAITKADLKKMSLELAVLISAKQQQPK